MYIGICIYVICNTYIYIYIYIYIHILVHSAVVVVVVVHSAEDCCASSMKLGVPEKSSTLYCFTLTYVYSILASLHSFIFVVNRYF